jgi:cytochrome c oxidase subunit 2
VAPVPTKTRRFVRRLAAVLPIVVLGALVLAPAASAGWFLPETNGSPNADAIQTLYIIIGILGLIISFLFLNSARRGATAERTVVRDREPYV